MKDHFSLLVIAICLPFILWAVCNILPTFDDFTSLQSPWWVQIADPGYFFPDSVRRPFDALLGAIVGWQPALFPTLNHVLIILGHTASAVLVYAICRKLIKTSSRVSPTNASVSLATNIATLFFFFSPATLGATLACDGFNQTYAQLWGLLSLWVYLSKRRQLWLLCIVMAVLSKENGLAWAIVPPLVAYAFRLTDRRQTMRDICKGLLIALAYLLVFATLTITGFLEYSEEYSEATLLSHAKDFLQLMAYTWMPLDYVSIVYAPLRNWAIAGITLLLSLPFLVILVSRWWLLKERTLPVLIVCFLILVMPHLVTVVSIMHNYAALSMAALIVAYIIHAFPTCGSKFFTSHHSLIFSFALFLAAALFTDVHHYICARQSGLLGKRLAQQAIVKSDSPACPSPTRVFCISIDNPEEPRYSSFCVRPVDAFAWGLSVRHYSHYEWTTHVDEVTLSEYDPRQVKNLADSALHNGNEAVWVVGHDKENLTILTDE